MATEDITPPERHNQAALIDSKGFVLEIVQTALQGVQQLLVQIGSNVR